MKKYLTLFGALLTTSCATTYQPSYVYDEILVVNNSRALIQDISIEVANSGQVFSCGNVAPFGICSNRFGKRRYERNPIQIGWVIGDTARQTEAFVVEVPATFYTGLPLRGVLAIAADGSISAYFEQDTPNI